MKNWMRVQNDSVVAVHRYLTMYLLTYFLFFKSRNISVKEICKLKYILNRKTFEQARCHMKAMVKDAYRALIDHIENRGDIVDIRLMIDLFHANIGIGYWFDASKPEDFDWAFQVFKLQTKIGYDFPYFKTHVHNFLRSNQYVNYSSINPFEQIREAIISDDLVKVSRFLIFYVLN